MLMSQEALQELTGYKHASYQMKWLRQNGISFLIGADGKPRVMQSQIEALIGSAPKSSKRRAEPDVKALEKWMGI